MDRTWIYAGLLIAGGAALVKVLGRAPTIKRGERLLLVGDSLALGLAPPLGQLAKENGVLFRVVGKTGSTVGQWAGATSLNAELVRALAEKPAVVLVSLGTNDEALSTESARAELPQLERLIALIEASGAELGWIGPPKLLPGLSFSPNGFTRSIQKRVPQGAYFASDSYDIPRAPDRLHPTVRGYAGWAGAIWQWLRCCRA